MSVNARTTVSTSPASMRWRSPSMVRWRSLRVLTGSPSAVRAVRAGSRWARSAEQAAQERGGVVAVVLHHLAGPVGGARRRWPGRSGGAGGASGRCWARAPGSRRASSRGWTGPMSPPPGGRAEPLSEAIVRWSRESACRWARLPAAAPRTAASEVASRSRSDSSSVVAGGEVGGAGLDDAAELQRVEPLGLRRPRRPCARPPVKRPRACERDGRCRRRGRAWSRPARPGAARRSPRAASPG